MMDNRPKGREKHITGPGNGVHRRGEGLGTGPVGSSGKKSDSSGKGRSSGGGKSPFSLLIILVIVLFGGGNFLFGGSDDQSDSGLGGTVQSSYYTDSTTQSSWTANYKAGTLNKEVAKEARDKRTTIKGNGKDTVTIMVYMCGTDLESKYGMATSDLQEMASANISDKVNIIVYTGGCSKWNNKIISNKVNQVYQVKKGGLTCLVKDAGSGAMTDPSNLASFIGFCKKNFPADRNELILWDHGGGSVSGYGYDEKKAYSGSMDLSGIQTALKKAGVTFDFIGFDACLMATVENAIMLDDYADYLIASEETEPGIGWYYTDWLTALSQNTSMSTLEIGQKIIDDYTKTCSAKCPGQGTTLSLVDLAELSQTIPSKLKAFASSANDMIINDQYKQVSDARYRSKEYAQSMKIDQIDLVHFAVNLGNDEGIALADAINSAVKYNRVTSGMANSYGLSIYFPYRKSTNVDTATKTYQSIGMDEEYSQCIKSFAKMQVSGQAASGGQQSAYSTLSQSQIPLNIDLSQFLFVSDRSLSDDTVKEYVSENQLNADDIVWSESKGKKVLKLTEKQWSMVHDLALNMFYDDGKGYVDMGLDNVFDFDNYGNLIGETDKTWLAINQQPVAYYYESTVEDGDSYTINGYVPAYLNGERVNLMIVFDNENPNGYIAGANTDYKNQETETVAKNLVEVKAGDVLDFVCDYYDYKGNYQDSYYLGESMTLTDETVISNVELGDGEVICTYRLTDIYNQTYWTPTF